MPLSSSQLAQSELYNADFFIAIIQQPYHKRLIGKDKKQLEIARVYWKTHRVTMVAG